MARRYDHLGDVEVFLTVVEKGSLSAAAVALGTTPSVLSRAVTRLEARLGAQLLRRSTRRLTLTEAGGQYLNEMRAAFARIEAAEAALTDAAEGELTGRVRMSAPTTYGHHRLPAMLAAFAVAHPRVRVEVSILNRNVDLVAEGFDLVIRLGKLPDSGLGQRRLEDAPLRLAASPGYLAQAGRPGGLDDLARHRLLPFVMPSTGRAAPWLFLQGGGVVEWRPEGAVTVLDDVLGCVSLAEAGLGICQSYDFVLSERLSRGALVEVLPELSGAARLFSILYPRHRHLPAATRALIDFLAASSTLMDRER